MVTSRRASELERALHDIERRVLEEVWLSRRHVVTGVALVVTLVMTAAEFLRVGVAHAAPVVAAAALVVAATVSGMALLRRRYRWCCAAAYCCGLAGVVGIGVFWWLNTGRCGVALSWLVVADLTVVALTVQWLTVIVTPLERSQPDMRAPRVAD
jgi:hypothetical protein